MEAYVIKMKNGYWDAIVGITLGDRESSLFHATLFKTKYDATDEIKIHGLNAKPVKVQIMLDSSFRKLISKGDKE